MWSKFVLLCCLMNLSVFLTLFLSLFGLAWLAGWSIRNGKYPHERNEHEILRAAKEAGRAKTSVHTTAMDGWMGLDVCVFSFFLFRFVPFGSRPAAVRLA